MSGPVLPADTEERPIGPEPPPEGTETEEVPDFSGNPGYVDWARQEALRTAVQNSQRNVGAYDFKNDIIRSTQQVLIENFRPITNLVSLLKEPISVLRDPGLEGTDADLMSYIGNPDKLTTLLQPPNGRHFVHATPAQLAVLEPLLRFYVVDKDGGQREVYFSDYTTASRLLKLASLRRSNGVDEVFNPKSEVGANVGVREFSWEYHNKHEGDRIVQASLNLYFGSLSELVNINYLQFLFTNGLENPAAPPVKKSPAEAGATPPRNTVQQRILAYKKRIKSKMKYMQPGTPGAKQNLSKPEADMEKRIQDNFRQLKVAVGWSVPKGRRTELLRLFRGKDYKSKKKAMDSFLRGVKGTQKILLLNLRNYDVKFEQNGSCVLSIQYVASTDNFLAKNNSDVLGSRNFTNGSLNQTQVQIPASTVDTSKVWGQGYLGYSLASAGKNGSSQIYVRLDRLMAESDILDAQIKIKELENEASSRTTPDPKLKFFREAAEQVEKAYFAAKDKIKHERYSVFLERLMKRSVFQGVIQTNATDPTDVRLEFNGNTRSSRSTTQNPNLETWFKQIASVNRSRGKKKVKESEDIERSLFERLPGDYRFKDGDLMTHRQVFFVRFGDIIKVAMEQCGMRDDINWLLGSFIPSEAGLPGYGTTGSDTEINAMIYDIPISLEYFGQFFYKNVVAENRDEWPFRVFLESLLSMVTQALNRTTKYRLRMALDYTVYSTYQNLLTPTGIMTPEDIARIRPILGDEVYGKQTKVRSYYIMYVKQMSHRGRSGKKSQDEKDGIYHYTLGASRGLAKEFNFKAQDTPMFQAMNIESANRDPTRLSRALILPQNVDIMMMGNSLHKNGDLIYVDSRQALGSFANSVLTLGGYYRVVRSTHTISSAGYNTVLSCVFERRTDA